MLGIRHIGCVLNSGKYIYVRYDILKTKITIFMKEESDGIAFQYGTCKRI